MAKTTYTNINADQLKAINYAIGLCFDLNERDAILSAIDSALAKATTSAHGVVLQAAARANATSANAAAAAGTTPTKAEFDAVVTLVNELKTVTNDLLTKLRTAGVVSN